MTQPAKVQEPSMEEILASIRRIIADDEAKPPADAAKAPASSPAAPARPAPSTDAAASNSQAIKKPSAPTLAATNNQTKTDEGTGPSGAVPQQVPRHPLPNGDVLELTDDMALPVDSFNKIDPDDDLEFDEAAAAGSSQGQPSDSAQTPLSSAASSPQQMLSRSTVSAVESAFNTLAHTVLSNNARTLEDLVREMLRPMLKTWLDDNLPGLVERIVKGEIERVSRGR